MADHVNEVGVSSHGGNEGDGVKKLDRFVGSF